MMSSPTAARDDPYAVANACPTRIGRGFASFRIRGGGILIHDRDEVDLLIDFAVSGRGELDTGCCLTGVVL